MLSSNPGKLQVSACCIPNILILFHSHIFLFLITGIITYGTKELWWEQLSGNGRRIRLV